MQLFQTSKEHGYISLVEFFSPRLGEEYVKEMIYKSVRVRADKLDAIRVFEFSNGNDQFLEIDMTFLVNSDRVSHACS